MPSFENVVFAGGGNRCFWQAGFWTEAAPVFGWAPKRIAGVSAGAAISTLLMSGQTARTLKSFKQVTKANAKNFYPRNLIGSRPAVPHTDIYRAALREALNDEAVARLRAGPEIRVLLATVPRPLGPLSGVLVGFAAYEIEKRLHNPVHPHFARRIGFKPKVVTLQSCKDGAEMIELILATSATPPITPVARWQGELALDGGLVDNVPVEVLKGTPGDTLVLLTRRYPRENLPKVPGRTYVMPSAPIEIAKWDYTSPDGLQATFDHGRRDGEAFARAHR